MGPFSKLLNFFRFPAIEQVSSSIFGCAFFGQAILVYSDFSSSTSPEKNAKRTAFSIQHCRTKETCMEEKCLAGRRTTASSRKTMKRRSSSRGRPRRAALRSKPRTPRPASFVSFSKLSRTLSWVDSHLNVVLKSCWLQHGSSQSASSWCGLDFCRAAAAFLSRILLLFLAYALI